MPDKSDKTVLIIDDDRTQLKLYSWIIQHGGFRAATALVGSNDVSWPDCASADVVALDYRLSSKLTAKDVAAMVRERYPATPILVLSEMLWMPEDIAPHAQGFVSKGNPEELIEAIARLANHRSPIHGDL